MMLNKQMALAILGALPEDKLMEALKVAGLDVGGDNQTGAALQGLAAQDNKIEPWSQRTVAYGGGKDRPAMVDKGWAAPEMMADKPRLGMGPDDDVGESNIFLQTGGGS